MRSLISDLLIVISQDLKEISGVHSWKPLFCFPLSRCCWSNCYSSREMEMWGCSFFSCIHVTRLPSLKAMRNNSRSASHAPWWTSCTVATGKEYLKLLRNSWPFLLSTPPVFFAEASMRNSGGIGSSWGAGKGLEGPEMEKIMVKLQLSNTIVLVVNADDECACDKAWHENEREEERGLRKWQVR